MPPGWFALVWIFASFFTAGNLHAKEKFDADGLYLWLDSNKNGSWIYRLRLTAQPAVALFLQRYAGEIAPPTAVGNKDYWTFPAAKKINVKELAGDGALILNKSPLTAPQPDSYFPGGYDNNSSAIGVLAFWYQRNLFRSDIVLISSTRAQFQRPLKHLIFATYIEGSPLTVLKLNDYLRVSKIKAVGEQASNFLTDWQQGRITIEDDAASWQQWLAGQSAEAAAIATENNLQHDAFGIFRVLQGSSGETLAGNGDSIEYSYSYQSVKFADLRAEKTGVAILGQDRLPAVVDYMLHLVPVGESLQLLVPPWLHSSDFGEKNDDNWYLYQISLHGLY